MLLDGLPLEEITEQDKAFIERFEECLHLSLNSCYLRSLKNLPKMPKLQRLELSDNYLSGEDMQVLVDAYQGENS